MRLGLLLDAILLALILWALTLFGLTFWEAVAVYLIVACVIVLVILRRTE